VNLSKDVCSVLKISFTQRPSGDQYQILLVDFKVFLESKIKDNSISATLQKRGLYSFPVIHFKRDDQPDYRGYQMEGAMMNAIQIRSFSPRDSDIISEYADHLKENLHTTD
jgi:hypothetical protein